MKKIHDSKHYILHNSTAVTITYLFRLVLQFINRPIFLHILGVYYLGLSGVFSSILSVLALSELGIGASIVQALYKPIAHRDYGKVIAYMDLYKKVYRLIALVILVLGLCVLPLLPTLLNTDNLTHETLLIYLLFLANSVTGYLLFSYKRSLLFAHQENYVTVWIDFIIFVILTLSQWLVLLTTKNYLLFLGLSLLSSVISNVIISWIVDKKYPLSGYMKDPLTADEKTHLKRNVIGNLIGKIATVIVFSTDNMLISSFIGVTMVGLYSNYTMVTKNLESLLGQLIGSYNATIGNLIYTRTKEQVYDLFKKCQFLVFALAYIISISFFLLINPFITFLIGSDYLLSNEVIYLLSVYFFVQFYRSPIEMFISAYGLFWEKRRKPLLEALANLVLSLFFLQVCHLGIAGVLLGTILTNVTINSWYDPYILFKHGLQQKLGLYFQRLGQQWLLYFVTLSAMYLLTDTIVISAHLGAIIVAALVLVLTLILILTLFFVKTVEYRWYFALVTSLLRKESK